MVVKLLAASSSHFVVIFCCVQVVAVTSVAPASSESDERGLRPLRSAAFDIAQVKFRSQSKHWI